MLNKFFTLALFFSGLVVGTLFAQSASEQADMFVEIADETLEGGFTAYNQLVAQYEAATQFDPNHLRANYMTGDLYLRTVTKSKATPYLVKAYQLDPNYKFNLLYMIGLGYHYSYKFDDAVKYYEQYLSKLGKNSGYRGADFTAREIVERKIFECGVGKKLKANPEEVEIANAGPSINSEYDDYAPVLSSNADMIIFTSRRRDGNVNQNVANDNFPHEDVFVSKKVGDDWTRATNIGPTINKRFNDSNLALSADGKELYLYADLNAGDIFVSQLLEDDTWSEPVTIGDNINSEFKEVSVSISPDGQRLYFASDRPGGVGGFDIYVSEKDKKGGWKKAKNLGTKINTPGNEDGPFIDYDGETLYYSSDGSEGMGGFDIFRSKMGKKDWEDATNLGYPINTPDNDIYFAPTRDGKAYYASVREDGLGYTDIYILTIPDELSHEDPNANTNPIEEIPVVPVVLTVNVYDGSNATDAVVNLVGGGNSVPANNSGQGVYTFSLANDTDVNYQLSASKEGFESNYQTVLIPLAKPQAQAMSKEVRLISKTPVVADPVITRVEPKEEVVKEKEEPKEVIQTPVRNTSSKSVRNIYFDFEKSQLKDDAKAGLDNLVIALSGTSRLSVEILGHTDVVGLEGHNTRLSENRAIRAQEYLISRGIDASRITIKGMGSSKPLASNDQEDEGRELNRRCEFIIK